MMIDDLLLVVATADVLSGAVLSPNCRFRRFGLICLLLGTTLFAGKCGVRCSQGALIPQQGSLAFGFSPALLQVLWHEVAAV